MVQVSAQIPEDDDPLSGSLDAVERDLKLHQAYRVAYVLFFDLLTAASSARESAIIHRLRQQPVYQMAEFFYLLRAYGLQQPQQLQAYIDMHNDQIASLIKDSSRLRLYGFAPSRLKRALIDESTASKMLINYEYFDGAFDQSDLGRLLVEVMSPETCRKTVVTLSDAGFLLRSTGVYNSIIVRSTGVLERLFARHVRAFRAGSSS